MPGHHGSGGERSGLMFVIRGTTPPSASSGGGYEREGLPACPSATPVVRSLHDLGLAAWFGGSLAGAVGINGAAADVTEPTQRLRVANAGWGRWSPVNLAAVGAHLVGGAGLLLANKSRVGAQKGVAGSTVAGTRTDRRRRLGATAWSGALGAKLAKYDGVPVEGGTDPSSGDAR